MTRGPATPLVREKEKRFSVSSIATSPDSQGLISSSSVSIQAFMNIRWFDRN